MADRLSASKLPRAETCPASMALPAAYEVESEDAAKGTAIHSQIEAILRGETKEPLWLAKMVTDVTRTADTVQVEQCYAYDPHTGVGRDLGTKGRKYSGAAKGEIPGTLDLVSLTGGAKPTAARVIDWKSGFQWVSVNTAQLAFGALAVASAFDLDEVDVVIVKIDAAKETYSVVSKTIDALALAEERQRVRDIVDQVDAAMARAASRLPLDVVESEDGCRYCPAFNACPAKATAIVQLGRLAGVELPDPDDVLTSDEAIAAAYTMTKALEKWQERAAQIIRERVKRGPLLVMNGTKELWMGTTTTTQREGEDLRPKVSRTVPKLTLKKARPLAVIEAERASLGAIEQADEAAQSGEVDAGDMFDRTI